MRRTIYLAAFILGLWFVVFESVTALRVKEAKCAWCYSGACYSSSICGSGCVCMRQDYGAGVCVSFDRSEE